MKLNCPASWGLCSLSFHLTRMTSSGRASVLFDSTRRFFSSVPLKWRSSPELLARGGITEVCLVFILHQQPACGLCTSCHSDFGPRWSPADCSRHSWHVKTCKEEVGTSKLWQKKLKTTQHLLSSWKFDEFMNRTSSGSDLLLSNKRELQGILESKHQLI